jgi:poly(3-hydroxybutyrate) depolymerase
MWRLRLYLASAQIAGRGNVFYFEDPSRRSAGARSPSEKGAGGVPRMDEISEGTIRCTVQLGAAGGEVLEQWVLHGAGHAWSGGSVSGSHTDARDPDASREMIRFFLADASAKAATATKH